MCRSLEIEKLYGEEDYFIGVDFHEPFNCLICCLSYRDHPKFSFVDLLLSITHHQFSFVANQSEVYMIYEWLDWQYWSDYFDRIGIVCKVSMFQFFEPEEVIQTSTLQIQDYFSDFQGQFDWIDYF